jgi:small-conductance mechanosensitive channel
MQNIKNHRKLCLIPKLFLIQIFTLITVFTTNASQQQNIISDTLVINQSVIKYSEIPSESVEIRIKILNELNYLVSEETFQKINSKKNIALNSINPFLEENLHQLDFSKNIRFLENRIVRLNDEKQVFIKLKDELTGIISDLDGYKNDLKNEAFIWKNTLQFMESNTLNQSAPIKLTETIVFIDSMLQVTSQKNNQLLEILEKIIPVVYRIDKEIEQTKELLNTRQSQVWKSDQLPFFKISFENTKQHREEFVETKKTEFNELLIYLKMRIETVLSFIFVFILLVYFFIRTKRKIKIQNSGYGFYYKQLFFKILACPISAALVLTLILSLFILNNRPIIFREITFYAMVFPLFHVLGVIVNKQFRLYIYGFGVLSLLFMLLLLLSNESAYYRVVLLLISLNEFLLLTFFLYRFKLEKEKKLIQRGINFFVKTHLLLAGIGFISNLTGRILLTELVINAVFSNVFFGFSLFIAVILINGILVMAVDTDSWQKINIFKNHGEQIKKRISESFVFLAFLVWTLLLLRNFRILDYVFKQLQHLINAEIKIGSEVFSVDLILTFILVIYLSIVISNLVRFLLEEDLLTHFSLSNGIPHSIALIVKYSIITIGFFLAIYSAGVSIDKFTIIIGAMSVGIGFGLQNIFNNLVSGLILLFERPIQIGDIVEVGTLTGNVKSIGLRSSKVETFEGAEVIVPNGQLISNEVINWTLSDKRRRVELEIHVAYNSDIVLVNQILTHILMNHTELVKEPLPSVFLQKLGESSIDIILLFWISDYLQGIRIKSDILFSVLSEFHKNNIKIPFPQRDLHILTEIQEEPQTLGQSNRDS